MCIICASPIGVPQPTETQLRTMFDSNPHGAGYMTVCNGRVAIHKGFTTIDDFLRQVRSERFGIDDPVVYHFRISTQAGVTPQMTHPFPLTSSLEACEALDVLCRVGIAHNGIIQMTTDRRNTRYSDTALFITKYLTRLIAKPEDAHDPVVRAMIHKLIDSKMALLTGDGVISTVGHFITDLEGRMFSNTSYIPARKFNMEDASWKNFFAGC